MSFCKKLLGLMAGLVLMLGSVNSTEISNVSFDFMNNFSCSVKCNNRSAVCMNCTELSNKLNEVTGDSFKTTSINIDAVDFNTIVFNDVQSTGFHNIIIKGSENFRPRLVFNCSNKGLKINKLSVTSGAKLRINSDCCSENVCVKLVEQDCDDNITYSGSMIVNNLASTGSSLTIGSKIK